MTANLSDFFGRDDDEQKSPLEDIFEEEPVSLDSFVTDKKFLSNPPLSAVQYEAVRHIERIYMPELYPQMAAEFGGYWADPVRMTNLITLQWGKGCISENTPVYDSGTGRWRSVSEITSEFSVQSAMAVDAAGDTNHKHGQAALSSGESLAPARASAPFKRGRGRMLRVKTSGGSSIDVYEGHLFVGWRDNSLPYKNRYARAEKMWQAAGDLSVGDRIAVASRLDNENPVELDPREVELVGYWLGDGSMPTKTSTSWGFYVEPLAVDLIQRYVSLVESYEDITAKVETMQSGVFRIRATGPKRGRYSKQPLLDIIRKYGLYGSRAWDKHIPEEFYALPGDQIRLLLSSLWDTDGTIYFKKTPSSVSPIMEYATVSQQLATDVQRLLLRLGVASGVSTKTPKYSYQGERRSGRTAYTVYVKGSSDAKRLAQLLSLHGAKEELREAVADMKLGRVQQVRPGDIYWDRVTSIEDLGDGDYWDMNVPGAGSYVAGSSGGFINSNSGKDHVCRVASLRVAYLLLCLKSPQQYYEMPEQDSIHLLNIAANAGQANRAFFKPMTKAVERGWFKDKASPTRDTIQYDKQIEAVSGHSDAEAQEGMNIMLGVADEIDAFKARDEMVGQGKKAREASTSAETILDMLKTSASTRFPDSYKRVAISFPRYLGSTIQRLTHEGRKDNEEMKEHSREFVSGPLATWDVNPRVKGKDKFADDYRKDPIASAAKYECKPSRATDAYFRNQEIFKQAVDRTTQPLKVSYRVAELRSKKTGNMTQSWEPVFDFDPDFRPIQGARYALHGDLAKNGDRAGIAMSHIEGWEERIEFSEDSEGGAISNTVVVPTIKTDFVIAFESDQSAQPIPREIQIRWARVLCFELIKRGFGVVRFTFDQFQSTDTMQILKNVHGIESERVSADINDNVWKTLRDVAGDNRLKMPFDQLLMNELEALSKINGKVDHPPGGSKDMADAFACSIVGAIAAGGAEDVDGTAVEVGGSYFDVGPLLSPFEGADEISSTLGGTFSLPIGMKGMSIYG